VENFTEKLEAEIQEQKINICVFAEFDNYKRRTAKELTNADGRKRNGSIIIRCC
jgi:molecular chaperone GrpE (heat shock protein)